MSALSILRPERLPLSFNGSPSFDIKPYVPVCVSNVERGHVYAKKWLYKTRWEIVALHSITSSFSNGTIVTEYWSVNMDGVRNAMCGLEYEIGTSIVLVALLVVDYTGEESGRLPLAPGDESSLAERLADAASMSRAGPWHLPLLNDARKDSIVESFRLMAYNITRLSHEPPVWDDTTCYYPCLPRTR